MVEQLMCICCLISWRARDVAVEQAERDERDNACDWCVRWERQDCVNQIELVVLTGTG